MPPNSFQSTNIKEYIRPQKKSSNLADVFSRGTDYRMITNCFVFALFCLFVCIFFFINIPAHETVEQIHFSQITSSSRQSDEKIKSVELELFIFEKTRIELFLIYFLLIFRDLKALSYTSSQKEYPDSKNSDVSLIKHAFPIIPHMGQVSNF